MMGPFGPTERPGRGGIILWIHRARGGAAEETNWEQEQRDDWRNLR
jgi:hypothetical protein